VDVIARTEAKPNLRNLGLGAGKAVETKLADQTVKGRLDCYETQHVETEHVEVKKKKKAKKSWI
jgi:hypothetical protein